jgi:putative MATE family efflux protein
MQKDNRRMGSPQNKMGVMPIGKLLFNMALPMIIAMIIQALYNVVDSIYISRISESAVTALSLAFPVQNIQIGFATGIGVGVNALLSKSLGEGNQDTANRAAGNGVFLVGVVTALFILFGFVGTRPYFEMQSQVAETVNGGADYTAICCIFSLGIFVEVLGERLLQSSGRTFYTMITQGVGAVINIILDPVFIFGFAPLGIPAMGLAGAAIATVIGQWIAAILAVIFNLKCNPDVQFSLGFLKPRLPVIRPILTVGVPSIIMVAIGSVMNFSMNQILQGFSETATGVFGIYFKLQSFFFMPLFGINNATISIVAYNYGARNPKRITGTLLRATVTAGCIMVAGLLAFQLLPDMLLGIFNPSEEFLRIGRSALRIISLCFPAAAIGISLSASFQALGNGIYATIISLCRQMLVLVPAAYLLSLAGEVTYVWWSFPIAEVASLAVTLFFFTRIYLRKIKPLYN